jgi:hypothetical protein
MNRKYYFCLISLVLIGSIFLSACDTEKRKADEKELQEKLTNLLNSDPDEEKVTLLAIKYKTDPQVVSNIVDSYLSSHDFMHNVLKEMFDNDNKLEKDTNKSTKPTIIETIHNLSVKHQIAEDVLVSIIIDYQIWTAAEGDY